VVMHVVGWLLHSVVEMRKYSAAPLHLFLSHCPTPAFSQHHSQAPPSHRHSPIHAKQYHSHSISSHYPSPIHNISYIHNTTHSVT
jgi:hypothetical protein